MLSPTMLSAPVGENQSNDALPVIVRQAFAIAALSNTIRAYITATNRRLPDNDESASIENAERPTSITDSRVIAGTRYTLARRNEAPEKTTCNASSTIAGTHVTPSSSRISTADLPMMYSDRSIGRDRYNTS